MHFVDVRLRAANGCAGALRDCYVDRLGFEAIAGDGDLLTLKVGETTLRFTPGPPGQQPFYHFALLIPGDRFEAAHSRLQREVELLEHPEAPDGIFHFENWDALACYFIDPCGNIVEVIAHRGFLENGEEGPFEASEAIGLSELGVVVEDKVAAADALIREAGLEVCDGEVEEPGRLAFVGEKARTLILAPPGRNWLPTQVAAEPFPMDVTIATDRTALVELPEDQTIRSVSDI